MVTTPSDVSLEDARKAINMFEQVRVPILGVIENMSYLVCPHCEERIDVFSTGGGARTADQMNVHFLGALPLDPQVRIGGDSGKPVTLRDADDEHAKGFVQLAKSLLQRVKRRARPHRARPSRSKISRLPDGVVLQLGAVAPAGELVRVLVRVLARLPASGDVVVVHPADDFDADLLRADRFALADVRAAAEQLAR